jgi:hypothetical protein
MKLIFYSFLFFASISFGQDTLKKVIDLKDVTIYPKQKLFEKIDLYDETVTQPYSIKGFDQFEIFENNFTDEIWSTKNTSCISLALKSDLKDTFLHIKWNKDQDGCNWVGMGYGWDMWTGKDLAAVLDTLALQLLVRSTSTPFTNIPWAFGFEDYAGNQAWLGYNKSFLCANEIGTTWTKVEIPLALFPFEENDFDLFNVKQLIIQLFSEGNIEINTIKLVPQSKKLKEELIVKPAIKSVSIDGDSTDWTNVHFKEISGGHYIAMLYNPEIMYLAIHVNDSTAMQNNNQGAELWKGDAIEIAFSTNNLVDEKRKFYLLSDQHIGINCGSNSYCWDFKQNMQLRNINYQIQAENGGYFIEIAIPYESTYSKKLVSGESFGFEIAVDLGSETNTRERQDRWNSAATEGFHLSPNKWGSIVLE